MTVPKNIKRNTRLGALFAIPAILITGVVVYDLPRVEIEAQAENWIGLLALVTLFAYFAQVAKKLVK